MNIFVFVVLCGSCLEVVSSEAFLSIKFLNFRNPGGEGSNGHCCDGRFFMCMSPCDHKFTICLDQADSHPRSINYCTYGKSSSGEISNQDYINFRNKIGNLANPIIWRLHFWPGVVRLKINVEDVDDNNNDHVDFLSAPISAIPSTSLTGQRQTIRSRVSLNIEVRLYCGQNYYGYNCSILCEDTDNDSGHYTCNTRTGEKICHTGWEGDNCDKNIDDCVGVTCLNSGVCEDGINAYQCVCQPGYQGRFCEQEINECLIPSNCRHGDCVNNPGSFTCNCHNGYEGPACDVDIDECASSPCHNAALCTDLVGQFKCHCRAGYNGTTCEEDVDECIYAPCTNNGTCVNLIGSFRCDCLLGYRGHDCSLDVDECDRHPCDNSGTCQNYLGGYNCLCAQGFQGTDCERDIDECEDTHGTVCQNGATCHNSPGSFQCACTRGYYGKQCENDVDECVRIQCNNGGTCQNIPGDFYCQCPTGYTGRRCENNINECLSDICKNGGTCTDLDGSFQCACPSYWEGITCEENVNECFSQPCQNGGTCEDVVEGYVCACPREYLGHHCEKDLNECDFPDTCANNATCLNSFGGFMCDCLSGWQGQTCNEDINECESFSCNNLGSCINTDGSFYCVCPVNWGGPKCEVDVDECASTPCTNNGTCYNLPGSFFCGCQQGWTGMFCDVDVDECKLEPDLCISAGNFSLSNSSDLGSNTTAAHVMCVNTLPGFLCSCTEGWTGQFCDVDIETVTEPITTSAVPQVSFDVRDDQKTLDKHGTGTEDGLNQTTGSDNATDHHHTVLTIPFYLSCQITPSTQWIVNKGLRRLLEDMRLYEGRKLTVDHKYKIGSSENGDKVTSIHPIITVDDRKLSDPEMEHILNKVSYKFKNYFNCPLFLGAVIGRFSFSAEPLNSATPNWYPGLITACVVFVIVVIALIFIKFRRRLGRDKTYEVRSVNTSVAFRQEIYGDSVFNFRHVDDHARTCELSTDPRDTAMLVKTSGKKKIISIQNPLYATLEDVERTGGGGGGGSFPDTAAQASGGAWPTTSFDDMPDGQPKAVNVSNMAPGKSGESSYSVPTNNSYVTAGEVSAMGMQATSSKRMSTSSSSVSKEDMCAGSSGDNPGGRSYPPYVNVNAGANHQFALENRSDNSLSTFGDKRSRKERQFSERRRKVSQAEYEKYKNLPYIDDPTGGADTSSKGNSRQNAEQRY